MPVTPFPLPAATLAGLELFRGLGDAALDAARRNARARRVAKGTRLFAQGDAARRCHALIHGRIKIAQSGLDGQQLVVRFIGPGEMFGALALFVDHRYPADALAVSDSVEVSWDEAELQLLMRRFPEIALNGLAIVGRRLGEAQHRLRELSTEPVEQRIARALLRLARQAGRKGADGTTIDLPLRRQDIAELTGSTLHTVSRILAGWEQRGIARGGRQRVVIADAAAVAEIADDESEAADGAQPGPRRPMATRQTSGPCSR